MPALLREKVSLNIYPDARAAGAFCCAAQILTGNPDVALATASSLSSLLNTGSGAQARRRRAFRRHLLLTEEDRLLLEEPPSAAEQARASHRSTVLNIVSDVVSVSVMNGKARTERAKERWKTYTVRPRACSALLLLARNDSA